ncbi:MAG: glycosyltransferase [Muribaculaceae bacterium]|nr:glycosyltransferase [Muribaculaceae bacterium]
MKRVAILIPCYNEALTVGQVIDKAREVMPQAQIYVYDNNSTDGTAEVAAQHGAIVGREYRQGKGNVMRTMFKQIDADCYVMIDGDDTYSVQEMPAMCEMVLNQGVDMVVGCRTNYQDINRRPMHNTGNLMVRFLINKLFKSNVPDIMTGYRAMSREFVKTFPLLSNGFEIETEMTIYALDNNYLIKSIPTSYQNRPLGSTSKLNTLSDGFKVLKTILKLFMNNKPLLFFSICSILCLLVALVALIPVFSEYLQTGLVPRFPTLFVGCMLIILSFLMLAVGLILKFMNLRHKQLVQLIKNMAD